MGHEKRFRSNRSANPNRVPTPDLHRVGKDLPSLLGILDNRKDFHLRPTDWTDVRPNFIHLCQNSRPHFFHSTQSATTVSNNGSSSGSSSASVTCPCVCSRPAGPCRLTAPVVPTAASLVKNTTCIEQSVAVFWSHISRQFGDKRSSFGIDRSPILMGGAEDLAPTLQCFAHLVVRNPLHCFAASQCQRGNHACRFSKDHEYRFHPN